MTALVVIGLLVRELAVKVRRSPRRAMVREPAAGLRKQFSLQVPRNAASNRPLPGAVTALLLYDRYFSGVFPGR